jgi:hypothetical protein
MHVPSVVTRASYLRTMPAGCAIAVAGGAPPVRAAGPGSAFAIEALQAGTAQMQRASTALKKTSRRFVSRLPT